MTPGRASSGPGRPDRAPRQPSPGAAGLLAGRYRLLEQRAGGAVAGLWLGQDETLARPVAIRLLPIADPRATGLLEAAAAAGRLNHPSLAQVFDASEQDGYAYVVREWTDGVPLADFAGGGEVEPAVAQLIAVQVADAMRSAHGRGLGHGRLHPGNVVVGPGDTVKVTDLAIAAALAGAPYDSASTATEDAAGIAAVGYVALTGRWPGRSPRDRWPGLEPAPWSGGRPCGPRQLRAAVPRALDSVITRALAARPGPQPRGRAEPLTSPAAVARALHELPQPRSAPGQVDDPTLERRRRRARRLLALASLVAVGGASWLIGLAVGGVPGQSRFSALRASPTPVPGVAAAGPIEINPSAVTDFDPEGDGSENPTQAQLAVDGDPLTGWSTDLYKKRADFGGLKDGVGLLIDLGRPVAVRQVAIAFLRPGADVEIRVADARSEQASGYRVIAKASKVGDVATLTLDPGPTSARYWLVWITRLPRDGDGYRTTIGEVQLRR